MRHGSGQPGIRRLPRACLAKPSTIKLVMNSITVQSDQFGEFTASPESVFTFPGGIPGIEEFTEAVLVSAVSTPGFEDLEVAASFWWLHSTTDPTLAFLCVDPWLVMPEYEMDFDETILDITSPEDVMVLTIVTIGEDSMTANLRAPIVLNTAGRVATQALLNDPRWAIRTVLGV